MKVKLREPPRMPAPFWRGEGSLTESEPFIVNPRGRLTHRVRSVSTRIVDGVIKHYTAMFWCAGQVRFYEPSDSLVAIPPENRLVCERCEFAALRMKEKTTDELAGKHIHKGRLVIQQSCCQESKERN